MCSPKAAGSFSNEQCSDIVSVKLLKAAPLKNPDTDNQAMIGIQAVCSAKTVRYVLLAICLEIVLHKNI